MVEYGKWFIEGVIKRVKWRLSRTLTPTEKSLGIVLSNHKCEDGTRLYMLEVYFIISVVQLRIDYETDRSN